MAINVNFASQFQRLDRAAHQMTDLTASINLWLQQSGAVLIPNVAPDHRNCKFLLRLLNEAPVEQWGMQFGEIVHHLRASLDNAVLNIAQSSGASRSHVKRLAYPIRRRREDWAPDFLRPLPAEFQSEILRQQPFNGFAADPNGGENLLLLLGDLDNEDKHYVQVKPDFQPFRGEFAMTLRFADDAAAERNGPPNLTIADTRFTNGAELLILQTREDIQSIAGEYHVNASVVLSHKGAQHNVLVPSPRK